MGKLKHEEMKWICLLDDYSFTGFASHLITHVLGQSPFIERIAQIEAEPKKQGTLWYLISFCIFFFQDHQHVQKHKETSQALQQVWLTALEAAVPGALTECTEQWQLQNIDPTASRSWLGKGKMNALFDDCHHWKSCCVGDSWNKRVRKSHLVIQALSSSSQELPLNHCLR